VKFACPHCKQPTISLKQKLLAAKWIDVYCAACGGRSCAFPILMAVLYFFLVWDFMLFGYVAYLKHSGFYVGVMIAGWLFLELCGIFIPLAAMKPKSRPLT
jgi:hypothetical protein